MRSRPPRSASRTPFTRASAAPAVARSCAAACSALPPPRRWWLYLLARSPSCATACARIPYSARVASAPSPAPQPRAPRRARRTPCPAPRRCKARRLTRRAPCPAPRRRKAPRRARPSRRRPSDRRPRNAGEAPADGDLAPTSNFPPSLRAKWRTRPRPDARPRRRLAERRSLRSSSSRDGLPAAEADSWRCSSGSYVASEADTSSPATAGWRAGLLFPRQGHLEGTWFHAVPNCMNMTGAQQRTLREALAMGQDFCPNCIAFAKDDGDPAWSREADEYYHAAPSAPASRTRPRKRRPP